MSDWNSRQYLKFEKERTQPAKDLINRIEIDNPNKILDIGCGPGNSTYELKKRWPDAKICGIDNSEDMIYTAKSTYKDIDFAIVNASNQLHTVNEQYDIVFSNACIQWLPNHHKLLREMMELLNNDGILAIQLPMNFNEPIHQLIREVIQREKWAGLISNEREIDSLSKEEYFELLSNISSDFVLWETIYMHRMPSHESILEWYRGTGLRPYLNQLNEEYHEDFENDIIELIKEYYPIQKNGEIIFRFPRFFFIAKK